ncbi:hypothetical protein [Nocardia nova]|uniref:hypothetical protein n=1 Tax=Nocardia nova TaxID=37330 RepID=UPI002738E219|nr:hypothetical protein [Nocardia nova]
MGSTAWVPRYVLPNGAEVEPGTLWQVKGGGWMQGRPVECRNGHPLGPGQVTVGTQACTEMPTGFHTTHTCRTCDATIYTPPVGPNCHHTSFDNRPAT